MRRAAAARLTPARPSSYAAGHATGNNRVARGLARARRVKQRVRRRHDVQTQKTAFHTAIAENCRRIWTDWAAFPTSVPAGLTVES